MVAFEVAIGLLGVVFLIYISMLQRAQGRTLARLATTLEHRNSSPAAAWLEGTTSPIGVESTDVEPGASQPASPAHVRAAHAVDAERDPTPCVTEEGGPLVSISAIDHEGNPRPKSVSLSAVLCAAGIGPGRSDPITDVITGARAEVCALADLASNTDPERGSEVDLEQIGGALEGIVHRLDLAIELADPVAGKRGARAAAPEREPEEWGSPPGDDRENGKA
jgi:hypothetical protein